MTRLFYSWIKDFKDEDSARGDLARDVVADKQFPKNKKHSSIKKHLLFNHAVKDCFDIFEKCYQQYLDDVGQFVEGSKNKKKKQLAERFGVPIGHIRNTPVLRAVKRLDWPDGWRVYCKYCLDWHLHGMNEGANLSHRVSYCTNHGDFLDEGEISQYIRGGYYMLAEPVWPTEKSSKKFSESESRTRKYFTEDDARCLNR